MNIKHYIASFLSSMVLTYGSMTLADCPNAYFTESCTCSPPVNGYCISSGVHQFTSYQIASNLKDIVAPAAGFELKVLEGGSLYNIQRMRWQEGVKFAIVQSDILELYKTQANQGNKVAQQLIQPLRVILPLYNEEIHIFTRKDSAINSWLDLKDKTIALGPFDGGSAMTTRLIYQLLFDKALDESHSLYSPHKEALKALAVDKTVDAWIMVVGQPTPMFKEMAKEAKDLIKLVPFNPTNNSEAKLLTAPYLTTTIKKDSYPWLEADVPTLTTKALLISQVYTNPVTQKNIKLFTSALCKNLDTLKTQGHAKWQEVSAQLSPLPKGWEYSAEAKQAFSSPDCAGREPTATKVAPITPPNKTTCSSQEAVLGLCLKTP